MLDDQSYSIRSICVCNHARDLHRLGYTCEGKAWNFLDERTGEGPCDCLEYVWDETAWQADEDRCSGTNWMDLLSRLTAYQNAFAAMIVIVEQDPLYTGRCWRALRLEVITRLYVLGMYDESAWTF